MAEHKTKDEVIALTKEWLAEKHCSLWDGPGLIHDDTGRQKAAEWIYDLMQDLVQFYEKERGPEFFS